MKKKSLLLIGALVSLFTTASAAGWVKPVPASQPLAADGDTEQYLYNVEAEAFLLGANDWNTRASVSQTKGYKWKVEMVDEVGPYYTLTDLVETKNNQWLRMFADSNTGIWVDNNGGANNATWTIIPGEGNKFNIGNDGVEGLLGVRAADKNDTRCYFDSAEFDGETETLAVDWYSVSVEDYESYILARETYNTAMELQAVLEEAKAKGVNVSAWEAVYNNTNSTLEELKAAIEAVKTAINNAAGAGATWDSPIDMTASIVDPSFETGAMGAWTTQGSGGDTGVKPNSNETYTIENADGDYVFNTWGRDPLIVTQELAGMPAGIYSLTALYASDAANVGNIYANDAVAEIKADPAGKTKGVYGTVVAAHTGGTMTIGMKSGAWFKADNFTLLFHGSGTDALTEYVKANVPQYSEEDQITVSVYEAWSQAVDDALNNVTDVESALAAIATLKEAAKEIEVNMAAWEKYMLKLEMAQETLQDESIDQEASAVLALGDYLMEAEEIVNNKELTKEEIEAEIVKLEEMVTAAMQCLKSGADFTRFLQNPEMDSATGWSGNPTINQKCGERYGSGDFDVYQTVSEEVPVGLYEISMQGFFRQYRDDDASKTAWYNIFLDTEDARTFKVAPEEREAAGLNLAYVYMNSNKTPLNCVYDYAQEGTYDADKNTFTCDFYGSGFSVDPYNKYAYPNNMATAAKAFADGAYKVSAYGLVAKAGDKLRIGVKGNLGTTNDGWAIFDNFKLTFREKDPAIINKLLPDAKAALNLEGKKVGKDVRELVAATLDAAENAASNDEKFEALAKCFDMNDVIENSVKLFEELGNLFGSFETALNESEASEELKAEAGELFEAAYAGWDEETYTDAEAKDAIKTITVLISKLGIPASAENASDENPCDLTSVIKDAAIQGLAVSGNKYGAWTWTKKGDNGPAYDNGNAVEFWAGNAADLEFTFTQDLYCLPVGTYVLEAKANNSYNGQESLGNEGRAYLFAQEGDNEDNMFKTAVEPNTANANEYVDYKTLFVVKEEDGVVTLGFKTIGKMDARWFSCDDFKLTYYGKNSKLGQEVNGDVNGDGIVNILDLNLIIDKILGENVSGNTDVDGNGETEVLDLNLVIDIILGDN